MRVSAAATAPLTPTRSSALIAGRCGRSAALLAVLTGPPEGFGEVSYRPVWANPSADTRGSSHLPRAPTAPHARLPRRVRCLSRGLRHGRDTSRPSAFDGANGLPAHPYGDPVLPAAGAAAHAGSGRPR